MDAAATRAAEQLDAVLAADRALIRRLDASWERLLAESEALRAMGPLALESFRAVYGSGFLDGMDELAKSVREDETWLP